MGVRLFTGLVEECGSVVAIEERSGSKRLVVSASIVLKDAKLGDSIAVNGACLTIVGMRDGTASFDLLTETWRVTSFSQLTLGNKVNLERALLLNSRMGGHFMTGHVDGTGTVSQYDHRGHEAHLEIKCTPALSRYCVHKGCIAVDGVSLTIAEVEGNLIRFFLIPHTLSETNLHARKKGDLVNLETDLLAKYVEKLIPH